MNKEAIQQRNLKEYLAIIDAYEDSDENLDVQMEMCLTFISI